jgi:hypothetical protein
LRFGLGSASQSAAASSGMCDNGTVMGNRTLWPSETPTFIAKSDPSDTRKHAPPESPAKDGASPLMWLFSSSAVDRMLPCRTENGTSWLRAEAPMTMYCAPAVQRCKG